MLPLERYLHERSSLSRRRLIRGQPCTCVTAVPNREVTFEAADFGAPNQESEQPSLG
jgi:hypothetical protein